MRLSEVKASLKQAGRMDQRELFSYATLAGTVYEEAFQNLVGVVFEKETMTMYRANIDGSLGEVLVTVPYPEMEKFQLKHRFLYSFAEFSSAAGNFRFYSYDKAVFLRGFRDAGLVEGKS